jgi:hypothetical protein
VAGVVVTAATEQSPVFDVEAHEDYSEAIAAMVAAETSVGVFYVRSMHVSDREASTCLTLANEAAQDALGLKGALHLWRMEHGYGETAS